AYHRIPVLMDGLITNVAALLAGRLCPNARSAVLASHTSDEPAVAAVMGALDAHPLIDAGMRLGEGTGAMAAIPMLDMALAVYSEAYTFDEGGIEPYRPC
ncbi:MAG: nicotinate-nucleotide--dimethylbenzimidazole phosphoribosyltransferase, partial [Acutalibacteraceae bacterium]